MEIQDIKQSLSLLQVLAYYGLSPDRNHRLNCPFHADKTPSMQVYYQTNTVFCFSSNCKTHGRSLDVIDIIMHKENCSKHEAILKAQTIGNLNEPKAEPPKPEQPITNREQLLERVFTSYKAGMLNSSTCKNYLEQRGLDFKRLEVGYNSGQMHHKQKDNKELIEGCVSIGLLKPDVNGYRSFGKYSIVFALKNEQNRITGLYFRSMTNNDASTSSAQAKHFYLKDSTGLYPEYPKQTTQKLIIAESIIDAASLLQVKLITDEYSILAAYGTNRLNEEMQAAIKALQELQEIVFAFDNDEAGYKASIKYKDELQAILPGITISRLKLPNKDVNETLQAHDEGIFIDLLKERSNDFSFFNEIGAQEDEVIEVPEPAAQLFIDETIERAAIQEIKQTHPTHELNTDNPYKLIYTTDTAVYYVQGGLPKTTEHLKIMLVIESKENGLKARNKVDLYEDKQAEKLCKEVAEKLNMRKDLLEADLYRLTELLESEIEQQLKQMNQEEEKQVPVLTLKEREVIESFLKQEKVIKRVNVLLGKTGVVGEERNRIFLFLIAVSYKMKEPLHSLIQGSSGSGKTRLVRQISDCMPEENVCRFTRLSDKALYNFPQYYFRNKLLIIEDVDGLSEEAELGFRELQSGGELRSGMSIKQENGQITGGQKVVSGPIASMSCTTKGEVYEDNMSRVFLIAVDESTEQTQRIIQYQNQKASDKINSKEEQNAKQYLQKIVRLLEPKEVINPFAEQIKLPEEAHKIRRLNDLFQNFIKMVTLINQYRRKQTGTNKLVAEIEDIETAIEIMFESIVLKVDELDGSLRQFYEKLKTYLQKEYKDGYQKIEFTQREIRQSLNISKAQINRYLQSLVELEYLQMYGFANKGFKYKISYWDNYQALRQRIKDDLTRQLNVLKELL